MRNHEALLPPLRELLEELPRRLGALAAVGRQLAGVDAGRAGRRLRDLAREGVEVVVALALGEVGEIWIKGPNIVKGYWNKPEATAETFTDGWLHSGDVGYLDEEGFVYISDRAKDMLIRGGENVYCVEVENVLFDHPDVVDAAVVGVPHKTLGEEVKAVVQLRSGASRSEDELREFCRSHLADFKVPEYVEFRDEPLPRNPAGKVLKNLLRGGESSFATADDQAL